MAERLVAVQLLRASREAGHRLGPQTEAGPVQVPWIVAVRNETEAEPVQVPWIAAVRIETEAEPVQVPWIAAVQVREEIALGTGVSLPLPAAEIAARLAAHRAERAAVPLVRAAAGVLPVLAGEAEAAAALAAVAAPAAGDGGK